MDFRFKESSGNTKRINAKVKELKGLAEDFAKKQAEKQAEKQE